MNDKLVILQHNAGRGAAVMDLILNHCIEEKMDILMLQEPYTKIGLLPGFEVAPFRTMLSKPMIRSGSVHKIHGSAIIVCNASIRVLFRDDLTMANFSVATIQTGNYSNITLVSAYFKFADPTATHLEELQKIINEIDTPLILAADVNAHSATWFNLTTDRKGEMVDRFIEQNDLHVINVLTDTPTYRGPRYSSNVDITACSRSLVDSLGAWTVDAEITTSDHAVIQFELRDVSLPRFQVRPKRFCERLADWDCFDRTLLIELANNETLQSAAEADLKAAALVKIVHTAARKAIPIARATNIIKPPRWTNELTAPRKSLRRASRTRFIPGTRTLSRAYVIARNVYLSGLRRAKMASWKTHCSSAAGNVWGSLYKWLKKGSIPATAIRALRKCNGSVTSTVAETVELLLNTLIPHDDDEEITTERTPILYDTDPSTEEELKTALWRTSPGKAPGLDLLTAKIARRAWPLIKTVYLSIVNECLRHGQFPSGWKGADVVAILKGPGKDPCLPNSYRPISLLPIFSKALERVICTRIDSETRPNVSGLQYGFVQGRSTETAIADLLHWHANYERQMVKYTLAVFLDISGAFDNLQWNALFADMQALGCSPGILAITRSNLSNRSAHHTQGGVHKTVRLTKGCPQGSLFGPVLWNITMEALLKTRFPEYIRIQAYADDVVVSIAGRSKPQLQTRANEVLNIIRNWGLDRSLCFSTTKSAAVILRGSLLPTFSIKMGGDNIRVSESAKFLGVWLDQAKLYRIHVERLRDKNYSLFSRLRGVFGKSWGLSRENTILNYNAVFIPKICYAARYWAEAATHSRSIATLTVLQRPLMQLCKY